MFYLLKYCHVFGFSDTTQSASMNSFRSVSVNTLQWLFFCVLIHTTVGVNSDSEGRLGGVLKYEF
jgi:hypothetical protein